ncbi:Heparinase II/III-like protein [Paenibacillus sp. UNCCL117]|uniref:fibronectin type III domain-containing protein n=1 Tax=unclassified Paenibacillus TaxID=185978 RepID=UPI0008904ADA|nr:MULTISPECIES: fibronectin type III domain-containing protein [unclassified Paenibacillus]SDC95771.1 Heparinase II/III-like protein [Paenibacillus sp. cl123]SFW30142.1 Heparinase II/III-like protein [Paenibacillus sp. UNCCL117]
MNFFHGKFITIPAYVMVLGWLLLFPLSSIASEPVYAAAIPEPIEAHPRVFATANDRTDLAAKWNAVSGWARIAADRLESDANSSASFLLPKLAYSSASKSTTNESIQARRKLEALAFKYLMDPDANLASGQAAVAGAKDYYESLVLPAAGGSHHIIGRNLLSAAFVYDWCYALLSDEDKSFFIERIERMASQFTEIGYPAFKQSAVTSPGSSEVWLLDLLAAGIAIYDEKPEMYNIVSDFLFEQVFPARDFLYKSGMPYNGVAYGPGKYMFDLWPSWLYRKMGLSDPYQNKTMKDVPYRWLYERRPDGQLLRSGDNYFSTYELPGRYWDNLGDTAYPEYLYQDGLIFTEADRIRPNFSTNDNTIINVQLFALLLRDLTLKPKPVEDIASLPLTRYFGSPIGSMIARTGWGTFSSASTTPKYTSTDVVAEMKIQEWSLNDHAHWDAGSFQLYYKGALAIKSGVYEGKDAAGKGQTYESPHDLNYHKRSIAANTLLIEDKDSLPEKFEYRGTTLSNDGGQRIANNGYQPANLPDLLNPAKGYRTGTVLSHGMQADSNGETLAAPDFSYLKGDITAAYSNHKVSDVKRSFVFLNLKHATIPAALITYDKITATDPSFEKKWLFHSEETPVVNGNRTVIQREEGDYNGKLVNDTMLPSAASADVTPVGGAGNEYLVDGTNYEIFDKNEVNTVEGGTYRVEVSPKTEAATDRFMNVMQVMDVGTTPATPVALETRTPTNSKRHDGVMILDRVVFFAQSGERNSDTLNFTVTNHTYGNLKFLITDMAAGVWCVQLNGGSCSLVRSTKEGGFIDFEGAPGPYTITNYGFNSDITPPSTPNEFKAKSVTENSVTLEWTESRDNLGIKHYEVFRDNVSVGTTEDTSMTVTGLTSGVEYAFKVKAVDLANRASGFSSEVKATPADTERPSVPVNVQANAGGKFIELKWGASTDNVNVTSYDIYEGDTLVVSGVTGTSRILYPTEQLAIHPDQLYRFTVVAKDAAGNQSSARTTFGGGAFSQKDSSIDVWTTSAEYPINSDNVSYIEAEKYRAFGGQWYLINSDSARSEGIYMRSMAASPNDQVFLEYKLNVATAGNYYISLLGKGGSAAPNHMTLRIDNNAASEQHIALPSSTWSWQRTGATFYIPAGSHTLRLLQSRSELDVDKIAISTQTAVPTGLGGTALKPVDSRPPTQPELSYSKQLDTVFKLMWTKSTDNDTSAAPQYEVLMSTGTAEPSSVVMTASSATQFTPSALTLGTRYNFKVRAIDASGNETFSHIIHITPFTP